MEKVILKPLHVFYGAVTLLYLLVLLEIKPQEPAVFLLVILSVLLLVVRMRFQLGLRLFFLDVIVLFILSAYFDIIVLMLPALMYLLYHGKLHALFLIALMWFGFYLMDVTVLALLFLTASLGTLLHVWQKETITSVKQVDDYREKVYAMEAEHELMLQMQDELSKVGMLSERDRIAQHLHDDLGHELTGALLALRALKSQTVDAVDTPLFKSLESRLENAMTKLKNTVHDTKSEEPYGPEAFFGLVEAFTFCKIATKQTGSLHKLDASHWHILISVLKEGLTNIQKHSTASYVDIDLLVEDVVVRLMLKNNGVKTQQSREGMGLKYMRRRIEAFGGNMSLQKQETFTLVVVLPLLKAGN